MKKNTNVTVLNRSFALSVFIAVLCLPVACDRSPDSPPEIPAGTGRQTVFTSSFGAWTYFSFATGDTVGAGNIDNTATPPQDDASWKDRTDWDIAIHMNNVRTNSGTSGNASGGAYDTGESDFDAVADVPAGATFTVDTDTVIWTRMPPPPMRPGATCGVNSAINWATLIQATQEIEITSGNVFLVKTASGKYAKVQLVHTQKDADNPLGGQLTVVWFYQPDGSTRLQTQ
ncbi:MAG: HmuY family protein [Prevotellaceae bacterium]|jgi:hypothetical protein|nr:HmuY family protein [Prevotellaceae bacterium]